MKNIVDCFGDLLVVVVGVIAFLYAPFARSFIKALGIVFISAFCWSFLRIAAIIAFNEPCPPVVGFMVFPFFVAIYASIAKAVKTIVFEIPYLAKMEERFLERFAWKQRKSK